MGGDAPMTGYGKYQEASSGYSDVGPAGVLRQNPGMPRDELRRQLKAERGRRASVEAEVARLYQQVHGRCPPADGKSTRLTDDFLRLHEKTGDACKERRGPGGCAAEVLQWKRLAQQKEQHQLKEKARDDMAGAKVTTEEYC